MSDAKPMDPHRRLELYWRSGRHLTPRQRRRFWHKVRRQVGGPREYYGTAGAASGPGRRQSDG